MFHGFIGSSIINTNLSQDFIDHHIDDKFKSKKKELIKINRIKLVPKLMTFATIGIALLLFSAVVQAKTTTRPIDDYAGEYIYFMGSDWELSASGWYDPESGLMLFPHVVSWFMAPGLEEINFLFWGYKLLKDCPHGGIIKERTLDEEHVLITINLHASEVPFMVFSDDEIIGPYPYATNYAPIYKGIMNYNFECKIIFNKEMLDEWFDLRGRLPSLAEIDFIFPNPEIDPTYPPELLPVITFVHISGNGYITEGEGERVVVSQVGILDTKTGERVWPKDITIVVP